MKLTPSGLHEINAISLNPSTHTKNNIFTFYFRFSIKNYCKLLIIHVFL